MNQRDLDPVQIMERKSRLLCLGPIITTFHPFKLPQQLYQCICNLSKDKMEPGAYAWTAPERSVFPYRPQVIPFFGPKLICVFSPEVFVSERSSEIHLYHISFLELKGFRSVLAPTTW